MAALFRWDLFLADVSTAFLQGLSFEELSRLTGQRVRSVSFTPPPDSWPHFKRSDGKPCHVGMAKTHQLKLLKAGYGLNDAPRLWRLRLD